jgi:hypothetical protein
VTVGSARPRVLCGRCGRDGPLGRRATAEHPDLCRRCSRPAPRRCGVCGHIREISIRARDGQPDTCGDCAPRLRQPCGICGRVGVIAVTATASTPRIGRCCWRPPTAVCSQCGQRRPCFHARQAAPRCLRCTGLVTCVDCGRERTGFRRVPEGVICDGCDMRRGNTTAACRRCSTVAPLSRGLCPRCRLHDRVRQLRDAGQPAAVLALDPFLTALAAAPIAASTLRWL